MQHGKLVAIAVKHKSRAAMVELDCVEISTEQGVAGDFRGRPGSRQVTVLSAEQWSDACAELEKDLPWTTRRANLLVAGLTFANTKEWTLQVGEVLLRITGQTEPCGRMEEQVLGLRQALTPDWRGGVCCRVIRGGSIEPGMDVVLTDGE